MTPRRIKALRIKLRNEIWRAFPRAEAAAVYALVFRLDRLVAREALNLVDGEHAPDCACWACVLSLNADVTVLTAERRAALEAAEEYD